ncbi:MAG: hypothetical protein F2839_02135 [Actinobacteria bacterium]|uniref:Unannotated protein n=1 Tax=freshwater metagenome TaxID=449393 RepID=A0A6J5YY13_9ZZZZ|nr:hypothetical protein [Actinomycetota bacterium]
MADNKDSDPTKAAFLAALERKKAGPGGVKAAGPTSEKLGPKSNGPSNAKRISRRRSGSS